VSVASPSARHDDHDHGNLSVQYLPMKAVVLSSIRVTNGSLAWSEAKKTSNRGMTKTASTKTVTTDIAATTDG